MKTETNFRLFDSDLLQSRAYDENASSAVRMLAFSKIFSKIDRQSSKVASRRPDDLSVCLHTTAKSVIDGMRRPRWPECPQSS
jgi:hypothetical protein